MNIKKTVYVYFFISLFISVFTCFLFYTSIQKTKKIVVVYFFAVVIKSKTQKYFPFFFCLLGAFPCK